MQLPLRKAKRLYQGNTWRMRLRWYTSAARTTALDVSDRTYVGKIQQGAGAEILATVDMALAGEGVVELVWSDVQSAALIADTDGFYEVVETNADGDVTTLSAGPLIVEARV